MEKFANDSFIPVEYSEKLLTGIGNLMEVNSDIDSLIRFAKCSSFVESLVGIVSAFEFKLTLGQSQTTSASSFANHKCFELTLFMLLGLLEKTPILKAFVKNNRVEILQSLLSGIGTVIVRDHLYLSQVYINHV